MKNARWMSIVGLVAGLSVTVAAQAAYVTHTGKIRTLRVFNDSTTNDFITMEGLTAAESCSTFNGYVSLRLPARDTDQYKTIYQTLLAAKLGAYDVSVEFNTNAITNGSCTLRWVQIIN